MYESKTGSKAFVPMVGINALEPVLDSFVPSTATNWTTISHDYS